MITILNIWLPITEKVLLLRSSGIAVIDVALAMVVKPFAVAQYWMFDQDEE